MNHTNMNSSQAREFSCIIFRLIRLKNKQHFRDQQKHGSRLTHHRERFNVIRRHFEINKDKMWFLGTLWIGPYQGWPFQKIKKLRKKSRGKLNGFLLVSF